MSEYGGNASSYTNFSKEKELRKVAGKQASATLYVGLKTKNVKLKQTALCTFVTVVYVHAGYAVENHITDVS